MTAISGVTYFPMDWGSACQDLSEKVSHAMVASMCVLFAVTKFVALLYDICISCIQKPFSKLGAINRENGIISLADVMLCK